MTPPRATADAHLKVRIVEALTSHPDLDAARIGVGVTDGAVTLSGEVARSSEKTTAEETVLAVKGVRACAEEITVRDDHGVATDTDISREVGTSLSRAVNIARNAVTASVTERVVTLRGTVPWHYQREAVERIVRRARGVADVHNMVRVAAWVSTGEVKAGIERALVRSAVAGAAGCTVTSADQGEVTIRGTVGTFAERAEIDHVAWADPGVTSVHNEVQVAD